MALNESVLQNTLLVLFDEMKTSQMTNETYASRFAKAITDQIKTAEIPAGKVVVQVTGQAAGVSNPTGIAVE